MASIALPPAAGAVARQVAAAPDAAALRTAQWAGALIALEILLQRFAVPGQPVALLLVVVFAWVAFALRARVLEVDGRRLALWMLAMSASGVALILQTALLSAPLISTDSWILFMSVWLPAAVRFRDRRTSTYLLCLRRAVGLFTALAGLCVVMMASQLVGVGYRDHLAAYVPSTLLLEGFVTTYPIEFGSSIFRANGWIGLEASVVSFLIGLGLLGAILLRERWWRLAVLTVGLFTTFAGSGFFVVLVGVAVLLVFPARTILRRYALPAIGVLAVVLLTPVVQPLIDRSSGEFSDESSSLSLRAIQPYVELWPRWSGDELAALLGRGAGSAQRYVNDLGIDDLLMPTFGRIIFDYGLVAGMILTAVLVFNYLDGPSASIAFTCFVSLWALQPGGSQVVFALPLMALVTWFAPRRGPRIEEVLNLIEPPPAPRRRSPLLRSTAP
ncbi:MAG: hypothetical protein ACT4RN_21125 [Pseudonocardia sp.]